MKESRIRVIQVAFIIIAAVYIARLFYLQIIDTSLKLEAQNNAVHRNVVYPYRGIIFDRNGKMLVSNTPVYDIMVIPKEVRITDTTDFCEVFGLTVEEVRENLKVARAYSKVKPSIFIPALYDQDFARVQDRLVDYPGFFVQARSIRNYPQNCMANALGYIGEISKEKIEKIGSDNYQAGDYIGISGLEEEYEKELRGVRGVRYTMVNVRGIEKGSFLDGQFDTLSVAGKDLVSSIDIDLQMYAETLMVGQTGSIIALEPQTGEILAYVSAPSYNPNDLTGKNFSKNYRKLLMDEKRPLFNRPIMASYPPGSTFKTVNSLIALQTGAIDSNEIFQCNRSIVNCHGHHRSANFHQGIQYSCNPYAWNVFRKMMYRGYNPNNKFIDTRLGFEKWRDEVAKFGLGKKLGVDLPNEKNGNIPSVKYYNKYFGENRWAFETIYSLSLGQGEIGITPVQLANVAAIYANRGYYYIPHLIKRIGEKHIRKEYSEKHDLGYNKVYLESLVSAMADVVRAGTATMARSDSIIICGKTGTVQNPHGKDHSMFIGFAPRNNPKIAIAVVMENAGWGATASAPLGSLLIEKYIRKKVRRKWLQDYITKGVFFE